MERKLIHRRGLRVVLLLAVTVVLVGIASLIVGANRWRDCLPGMSSEERLSRSREAFAEQDFGRAEQLLSTLLRESPGSMPLRLFYGRVLLELGRLTRAREHFSAILKDAPQSVPALLGLGEVHERSGEQAFALSRYKQASELTKTDPRVFRLLGLAQYRSGDQIAAVSSLRQSLVLLQAQEDLSRAVYEIAMGHRSRDGQYDPFGRVDRDDPFDDGLHRHSDSRNWTANPGFPNPFRDSHRHDDHLR